MNKFQRLLCMLCLLVLAACSKKSESPSYSENAAPSAAAEAANEANTDVASSERLGTEWGDEVSSHVTQVDLKRESSQPVAESILRYANKDYQGRPVNSISILAGQVSFSVVDDHGKNLSIYRVADQYYLVGQQGQSYQLRYENHTGKTYEVVASVDGLDVLDGQAASRSKGGYVLNAYSTLNIEGFRKSDSAVASFTFSRPDDAYAANSDHGSKDNTGIIGTAIYVLKAPEVEQKPATQYAPPPKPKAFPADS